MSIKIFHFENGSEEKCLEVHEGGEITYSKSNSGWVAVRKGSESKFETLSAADAKARWPSYADEIERALEAVGRRNSN
jgi:hypothetical protein